MDHKLVITRYKNGIVTLLYHDGKAVEISYDTEENTSLVGNIYIGKVANVVKNIQAAFIEIENGVPCYYAISDNQQPFYTQKGNSKKLAAGDELIVQISRDAVKSKAPGVTSDISLSGRFLVLTAGKNQISLSTKINAEHRAHLKELMAPFKNDVYGWIVRTNAVNASENEILREAEKLSAQFKHIMDIAPHRLCRTCLYRNPPLWLSHLKDVYNSEYEEIITDCEDLYHDIKDYFDRESYSSDILRFYQDKLIPLSKLYNIESSVDEAVRERIWLKSGAYLVIQQTEALVAIDVNTGKFDHGKNLQKTFFKINMEAAKEIARQLRLRNLSGMILIDFINMKDPEDKRNLMDYLADCLNNDPIKCCVVDMTALGLVEVTRKRIRKSISEQFGFFQKISNIS
ncbi:MAG: ribonuclease E/G [Eubacteriales bacterium]|nr:ribonuclease E/G [Eubacteriales bacterium]